MTLLFSLIFILLVAYGIHAQLRHRRLKASCTAAFDRIYGQRSPRPGFEMSYSYGAPVFQILFASRSDMVDAAARGDNDTFLDAIDALCRNKGTKGRPFKAKKAIHFTHALVPGEPEPTPQVHHCCRSMRSQVVADDPAQEVSVTAEELADAARQTPSISYSPPTGRYALLPRGGDGATLPIDYCPWCGSRLSTVRKPIRIL